MPTYHKLDILGHLTTICNQFFEKRVDCTTKENGTKEQENSIKPRQIFNPHIPALNLPYECLIFFLVIIIFSASHK